MKLKVSFCNKTILKTDITRFLPLCGCYTLLLGVLVLMYTTVPGERIDEVYNLIVTTFSAWAGHMVLINGFYAMGVVLMLWGDLLTPRLCNSLHALPVTRDSFFAAHLVSALLFAFVPNVLVYGLAALIVPHPVASAPLMALAAGCLQYLFYLGVALVAVQLAGNRAGMVLIYGMLNFFTILLYWFCAEVFTPLTYGTEANVDWVAKICPTVVMYRGSYFRTQFHWLSDVYYYNGIEIGKLWTPAFICAGVGIVLIGIAQLLYRKRRLEAAGDLMAYSGLSPVFLVLNSLMVAAFIHLGIKRMASGSVSQYFFLPLGLVLGYVLGLMLLRRTSRVFRKRLLIPMAGIVAICCLTVAAIYTDAFRVIRRVPTENQVVSVRLTPLSRHFYADDSEDTIPELTDSQSILAVLNYHRESLNGWQNQVAQSLLQKPDCWRPGDYQNIRIVYTLENGRKLARRYPLRKDLTERTGLDKILSMPEMVFGWTEAELRQRTDEASQVAYTVYPQNDGEEYTKILYENRFGLADAIMEDSEDGNLLDYSFTDYGEAEGKEYLGELTIRQNGKDEEYYYMWLRVTRENEAILRWLNTHKGETVDGNG